MWNNNLISHLSNFLNFERGRDLIFYSSKQKIKKKSNLIFLTSKKIKFDEKKINLRCVWFLIFFDDFCYSYCWSILHASWCYPTTVWWLEKVYISNFIEESFCRSRNWQFLISTALGRTLLSNWKDSTHKTLYIIVC